MKNIAILGSTGSVGRSSLEVIRSNRESYKVELLVANSNFELLIEQYEEFQPRYIYLESQEARDSFNEYFHATKGDKNPLLKDDIELEQIIASSSIEIVVAAIVGIAGLKSVFIAVESGKHILLANKESYVVAGEILNEISKQAGSTIFPIDSEHSALHQCLSGVADKESVSRLILTGSGGPFLNKDIKDLKSVTPDEAVAHPIWNMGPKISVDSSTMMNKCLEIIEARWLFDIEDIDVVIHPEGIVHSLVEFTDYSLLAQLSVPDMKIPIAYGLGYPSKIESASKQIDFDSLKSLTFKSPDIHKFPALGLADYCIQQGGNSSIILNAANEECVDAFLEGKIGYLDIFSIISEVLDKSDFRDVKEIDEIFEQDKITREQTIKTVNSY